MSESPTKRKSEEDTRDNEGKDIDIPSDGNTNNKNNENSIELQTQKFVNDNDDSMHIDNDEHCC